MSRDLTPEDVRKLLDENPEKLIGAREHVGVEFKVQLPNLDTDTGKQELAKDVSGMANASGGGVIVIGVRAERTKSDPNDTNDTVKEILPFEKQRFNEVQILGTLRQWVYPDGIKVECRWHGPDDAGLASLSIEPEDGKVPYLVTRTVGDNGKVATVVFGYWERHHASVDPRPVHRLRSLIREGMLAGHVLQRVDRMEETLQGVLSQFRMAKAVETRTEREASFQRDLRDAVKSCRFEDLPRLELGAFAEGGVELRGMFDRQYKPNPKDLLVNSDLLGIRDSSPFDLRMDEFLAPIERVSGRILRRSRDGHKMFQISQDGNILAIVRGDLGFPCYTYTWPSPESESLLVNAAALSEVVTCFVRLTKEFFGQTHPCPNSVVFRVGLAQMVPNGQNARLHPMYGYWVRANGGWSPPTNDPRDFKSAPGSEFSATCQVANPIDSGVVTFKLVSELYHWFGWDDNEIHRQGKNDKGERVITPETLNRPA